MITEKNLEGLLILYPQVIDTVAALSEKQREEQRVILEKLLESAEGTDIDWLSHYRECMSNYENDRQLAMKESLEARKFAPSFVGPEFCAKQRLKNESKDKNEGRGKNARKGSR